VHVDHSSSETPERSRIFADVDAHGWSLCNMACSSETELAEQVKTVAQRLGTIIPGRFRQSVEKVVPQTTDAAYAGSLSSRYGLSALPLHTDTAHWVVPCRYLVIACAAVGPVPAPTNLLDVRRAALAEHEATACRNSVFLIRNARHSFYGSIMESGRQFVRIDPGCMSPVSMDGPCALHSLSADRHRAILHSHQWSVGDLLIIDNWRVLHGRGNREPTAPGRVLLRATIQ
jgi:alpha-ketoglutarate-dependent taurine dioxygenase